MSHDTKIRQSLKTNPQAFSPIGAHQQDATISSATNLPIISGANGILLQCTGQNIRYTLDGTTPTASLGFVLVANANPVLITFPDDETIVTVIEASATATVDWQAVRVWNS